MYNERNGCNQNVTADVLSNSSRTTRKNWTLFHHGPTKRNKQHQGSTTKRYKICKNHFKPGRKPSKRYFLMDEIMYKRNNRLGKSLVLVIPESMRTDIIRSHHDTPEGGNQGQKKTYSRLIARYWCPTSRRTSPTSLVFSINFSNKYPKPNKVYYSPSTQPTRFLK